MISACFTTFNRTDLLFEAVNPFISDDRVSEIIISDDCSREDIYQSIVWKYNAIDKVKIFRNEINRDCYTNKKLSIERATNEFVLILDSDNIFSKGFLNMLFEYEFLWAKDVIYTPDFAKPHFNFQDLAGLVLKADNIAKYIDFGKCSTMLNAMNYLVNREEYLKIWDSSVDPVTSDSIFQNYNWLKAGNSIYIVPGLEYEHRVHAGSHYQNNVRRTPSGFHDSVMDKLKALK